MSKTIQHQWFFPHPAETLWAYLTNSELLAEWLMETDFKPVIGHKFQFRTKAKVNVGFDGNIFCQVLEVTPFRKLSYSWRGGPGNGRITLDSVVTWTLSEQEGGTELLLQHSGFTGLRNALPYLIMNKGWSLILKKRLTKIMNQHVLA
jgi:uncharacterized protein YndB with AHSA1/START domain